MPAVESNGININYEECGSGEPLLLIMGITAPGAAWELHANEYKKHFRCILLDNRGAGSSDKPAGAYTTELMASDCINVMNALGIDRFHVNGISMGGAIAQQVALAQPSRVKSCVMTAAWAFCSNYMKHVFEMFKTTRVNLSPGHFSQMFFLWLYSSKFYGDNPEDMLENIQNQVADPSPMSRPAFESQAAACVNHNTCGKLGNIAAPVLLTTGNRDIFVPMECSQYLHANIKKSTLEVFDGYAHVHHWEDLERYNKVTTDFLLKHN